MRRWTIRLRPSGEAASSIILACRDVATPESSGELPPAVASVIAPLVIRQEMTVEAGLRGDRALALQVLATDPLVRDFATIEPLLDELLRAHAPLLPQF